MIKVWPINQKKTADESLFLDFQTICQNFGFGKTDVTMLWGPRRTKYLVDRRMQVAVALRDLGYSLPQIGRIMNRDHTSIMNLLERHKWLQSKHPPFRQKRSVVR